MPHALLFAFLALWLQSVHAQQAVHSTRIQFSGLGSSGGLQSMEQICTATQCEATTPLAFPFAGSFEVESTGGRLRGRARADADGTQSSARVIGTVSYSTMARAELVAGAPTALIEMGMMSLVGSVHMTNRAATTGTGLVTGTTQKTIIMMGSGSASKTSYNGTVLSQTPMSVEEPSFEELTATTPFATDFEVAVIHSVDLTLRRGGLYAASDFSHTIQFESLHFYDLAGNDVSQWMKVTFADPDFYLHSLQGEPAPVPEPQTHAMLLGGLALLVAAAHRRRRAIRGST